MFMAANFADVLEATRETASALATNTVVSV